MERRFAAILAADMVIPTVDIIDAVDGSRPTASQCAKVVVFMNHRETGAIHEGSYHDWC